MGSGPSRRSLTQGAEPASGPPAPSAGAGPFPRPPPCSWAWRSAQRCRGCWLGCNPVTGRSLSYSTSRGDTQRRRLCACSSPALSSHSSCGRQPRPAAGQLRPATPPCARRRRRDHAGRMYSVHPRGPGLATQSSRWPGHGVTVWDPNRLLREPSYVSALSSRRGIIHGPLRRGLPRQ